MDFEEPGIVAFGKRKMCIGNLVECLDKIVFFIKIFDVNKR